MPPSSKNIKSPVGSVAAIPVSAVATAALPIVVKGAIEIKKKAPKRTTDLDLYNINSRILRATFKQKEQDGPEGRKIRSRSTYESKVIVKEIMANIAKRLVQRTVDLLALDSDKHTISPRHVRTAIDLEVEDPIFAAEIIADAEERTAHYLKAFEKEKPSGQEKQKGAVHKNKAVVAAF